MSEKAPLLSVAMIVKDEEEFLAECLENVKPFVDEICIVDTGSVDSTLKIAESAGAKLKCFKWEEDFSRARNESLKLCAGKWIFVIDADERIAPEDGKQLRRLAEENRPCAYRIWTRNYTHNTTRTDFQKAKENDEWSRGFPGWFPSAKVRLFPNLPEVRFEGFVHETVLHSLEKLSVPIINNTAIVIHHYGEKKSKHKLVSKQWNYVRLGEKKIQQQPNNPFYYAELASQYAEMGLYAKAIEHYHQALKKDANHADWWAELGSILFIISNKKEAEQAYKIALKLDPNFFPALRNVAILCLELKRGDEALEFLYKAENIQPANPEILHLIGCILYEKGEKQKAKEYFYRSYTLAPEDPTPKSYLNL